MSVKLKAGSIELEVAYVEWLRAEGYNPEEGIDLFLRHSEFVRSQLPMIHPGELDDLLGEVRVYLLRRSQDPLFTAQFPVVYHCAEAGRDELRYTVTLAIADDGAEWIGRAWDGSAYLGEIHGSGSGPHANYIELARMHVESEIKRVGMQLRQR